MRANEIGHSRATQALFSTHGPSRNTQRTQLQGEGFEISRAHTRSKQAAHDGAHRRPHNEIGLEPQLGQGLDDAHMHKAARPA